MVRSSFAWLAAVAIAAGCKTVVLVPPREAPSPSRLAREAPAGSWVVYRPTRDRKLAYVRVVDERRPGVIVTVRIFDVDSGRFIREERP
jgi:hypothetical protein